MALDNNRYSRVFFTLQSAYDFVQKLNADKLMPLAEIYDKYGDRLNYVEEGGYADKIDIGHKNFNKISISFTNYPYY